MTIVEPRASATAVRTGSGVSAHAARGVNVTPHHIPGMHAALELARRGSGYAVAALCGAGGQGDALILRAG